MKYTTLNKIVMWYKVKELSVKMNKTQIGKLLGIHRNTVRSYLSMTLEEYERSNICNRSYKKKLESYADYILKELDLCPFLSSPQVHDRLKEHFPNLPEISERTVYNFVESIRDEYQIPKIAEFLPRQTMQIPLSAYGEDAQVDFGEKLILNEHGRYVRIYFFAIVLCRSRYKFIYLQTTPFTTESTVYAHSLAFQYFGGMPKRIIYDQDKVLLKSENLGDLLMTSGFKSFTEQSGFEVTFCRKQDPQSKGKVENVVKYVKNNFLKGRTYRGIEGLNEEVLGWLERTGNGKKHAATRLVPAEEFKIESAYLLPYSGTIESPQNKMKAYTVRKDNTIAFRGCFYSLPLGSYKMPGCKVLVEIADDFLHLYDESTGKQIASHQISPIKGVLVQNTDHRRIKSDSLKEMEEKVLSIFDYDEKISLYLDLLHRDKPRYYRDNLQVILKKMLQYDLSTRKQALNKCIDAQVYHAGIMNEIARTLDKKGDAAISFSLPMSSVKNLRDYDMTPVKSDLRTYQNLLP